MFSYIALIGAFVVSPNFVASKSTYTYCYNYTQCDNETISTTYAECYGFYGCEDAEITSTYTLAYGELGAYDATIDSKYTYSYGHYGSYGSSMTTEKLYSYGYQGSRVADIEPYDNELIVYFYGYYAGMDADISCYSGDYCEIWCGSGAGCDGVDFYCYSGATCFYDCSSDDVCPTSYSGVDSDLSYVTSIGSSDDLTTSSDNDNDKDAMLESNLHIEDIVVIYSDLTDDEITEYKMGNQLQKDKSKRKLEQDTKDDTNAQLRMTYEMSLLHSGMYKRAQQQEEEQEEEAEEEEETNKAENINIDAYYPNVKAFKNYKSSSTRHNNNSFFWGISLEEYGIGLIADIFIMAIVVSYNYCTKGKVYQQL